MVPTLSLPFRRRFDLHDLVVEQTPLQVLRAGLFLADRILAVGLFRPALTIRVGTANFLQVCLQLFACLYALFCRKGRDYGQLRL